MNDLDLENLVQRYLAGENVIALTKEAHIAQPTLRNVLRSRGLLRTKKEALALSGSQRRAAHRSQIDTGAVVTAYTNGEGLEPLAARLGEHPRILRAVLEEAGVVIRDRGHAMEIRMAKASPEDRAALTLAARERHAITRGAFHPDVIRNRLESVARSKETSRRMTGQFETELGEFFTEIGANAHPQTATGTYNLDFSLGPVAVEVHKPTNHPMTIPRLRERTVKLLDGDWAVLYVWTSRFYFPPTVQAAKYAVAFAKGAEGNAALRGECRVIRGSGELVAIYRRDPDTRTLVQTSEDLLDSSG